MKFSVQKEKAKGEITYYVLNRALDLESQIRPEYVYDDLKNIRTLIAEKLSHVDV